MPGGSEDGVKAGKDVIEQTNNRFKKVKEGEEKADKRRNASLATHWVPSGWVEKLVGTQWAGQEVENPAHGAPRRSLTPAEVLAAAQARKKKQQDDDERK
ncbi:hypothetical protein ACMFMG_011047 [Clarireedia jacksonii]